MKIEWILFPFCGSKTRLKIRDDTVLENFPDRKSTRLNSSHT